MTQWNTHRWVEQFEAFIHHASFVGRVSSICCMNDRFCDRACLPPADIYGWKKREKFKINSWFQTLPCCECCVLSSGIFPGVCSVTLSLLMSYIYGAPCKTRNFNVQYIWTYVWQRWKPSLSICCTMFQHWINAESFPVSQLCVNTLPATKINRITNGI
jgi:hypothetical protein